LKILIACDKFKGSLSSLEVCEAIAVGLKTKYPDYHSTLHPIADGGDGTMDCLIFHLDDLEQRTVSTIDSLGRPITASYLIKDKTAFIELASASGIVHLKESELNPMLTNTRGTGILINDAIQNGCKKIMLCLGGSCSNDVGLGIAAELGYTFLDLHNIEILPNGANLSKITRIEQAISNQDIEIEILSDVENLLYGPNGAAYTFAKQKGASKAQIEQLELGVKNIANLINQTSNSSIHLIPGGGAAGGVAAGIAGLYNSNIKSGFEYLSQLSGLEEKIASSDLVITGEGKLDQQSSHGKVIGSIAAICEKNNTPLIAIVGQSDLTEVEQAELGIDQIHTIQAVASNLEDAIRHGLKYLKELAQKIDLSNYS